MGNRKYLIRTVTAGDTIEVFKTQSTRYGLNIPRVEHEGKTPAAVEKNNQRLAERKLRQLINENFQDNDYHLIFRYFKNLRPSSMTEAAEEFRRYLRRVQYDLKKDGLELRYIWAVEVGKKGAIHFHAIANRLDLTYFTKQWRRQTVDGSGGRVWQKLGTVYCIPLWTDGQYKDLANYIIKQTSQTFRAMGGKRYNASRNLRKPKETVKQVNASTWRKNPKPPKGYIFDPSFPLENGVCEITGIPYQRYGLIRIDRQRARERMLN